MSNSPDEELMGDGELCGQEEWDFFVNFNSHN